MITLQGRIRSASTIEIKAPETRRLRYAHANFPECPLYNSEELPALPFDREFLISKY